MMSLRPSPRRVAVAPRRVGWIATLLAAAAVSASAQPAIAPGTASLPRPSASAIHPAPVVATSPAAAIIAQPAPPRPLPPLPRPLPPLPGEGVVRAANVAARSFPTADAYLNSTLYYDYEAGRLYEVETSPRFLTALVLRPGEKLVSKAAGDVVRWVLGETVQGSGANEQVVVLLKPIRGGLRTNVVLTTDQRTYLIEAASREGGAYTPAVSWTYPQEQMQALAAAQAAKAVAAQTVVATPALSVDQLHFDYRIETLHGKPPRWQPLRVFDDGVKTYIQFPINMAATDAPPLFLIGPHDQAQLVNYRYLNGYYIVDRLIEVADLRIGETPQTTVRITRTPGRG